MTDLQEQIALATLTAPIDGIVTAVVITPGLDASGTAITVAAPTFEVTADVVESDVSSMSTGPAGDRLRERDQRRDRRHGVGDRPVRGLQQRQQQRRLVPGHGDPDRRAVRRSGPA